MSEPKKVPVYLTVEQIRFVTAQLDDEPIVGWDEEEGEMVDQILTALTDAEDTTVVCSADPILEAMSARIRELEAQLLLHFDSHPADGC